MLDATTQPRERLPFGAYMDGFTAARDRFVSQHDRESLEETFPPLFEALNWATAIDLRITQRWRADPPFRGHWPGWYTGGAVLLGTRYARNCVHHQWADAVDMAFSGSAAERSASGFVWRWLTSAQLPPGRDDKFRDRYDADLAGHVVTDTLQRLSCCFSEAADHLELDHAP
jgi:hypothetical protein